MEKPDKCPECGTSDGRYPYFAYGSNMDTVQMRDRCASSLILENAQLAGFRFIINSRGVATVVSDDLSTIHGVLWQISEEDEARLDRYEGVEFGTYSKEYVRVTTEEGDGPTRALVYLAADSKEGKPRNGYIEKIIEAARRGDLPDSYVADLEKWAPGFQQDRC